MGEQIGAPLNYAVGMTTNPPLSPSYSGPAQAPDASYQQPQAPYQPAPPYGYNPYPYAPYGAAPKQTNGLGVAALIFGIGSYVILPFVGGIVAIVLGRMGQTAADEDHVSDRGLATAGFILGMINVIGILLLVLLLLLFVILGRVALQP